MKRVKWILATAILFIGINVSAQEHHHRSGKHHAKLERMTKELELTGAQKEEVKAIMKEEHKKLKELGLENLPDEEKKRLRAEKKEVIKAKIRATLTAEQQAKFDELEMHRKSRKDPKVHAEHKVERIEKVVALTPDQKTQLLQVFEKSEAQKQVLYKESRGQFKNMRKEEQAEMKKILSEEQLQKLKEYRKAQKK